jgi:hypothetical protein
VLDDLCNLKLNGMVVNVSHIENFAGSWDVLQDDIDWHLDKLSGLHFELSPHNKMNIRSNRLRSAKNVWEINRLHILTPLALKYKTTGDSIYLERFIKLIEDWSNKNPFLYGINWYSNIEVNIRLINFYYMWELLRANELQNTNPAFNHFVINTWMPLIYNHIDYSANHLSYYSSANNHLVSEYSGLFIATSKWHFKEFKHLQEFAKRGLEVEIVKQHVGGINKEEASEYIQFITDLFYLPFLVGKSRGNHFSATYQNSLIEIFNYIYEFRDIKGNIPRYGDDDDGHVLWQGLSKDKNNFNSLMLSAFSLTEDNKYIENVSDLDLKNRLIDPDTVKLPIRRAIDGVRSRGSVFYPKQGHYFFKKQTNVNSEIYFHFNAGPLGYLSIAAHGHSDALSFEMNINGIQFFIDPGTYCYHVEPEWRNYFVSSRAHNTITINNQNQAKRSGDTMWHNHYSCKSQVVQATEVEDEVIASHNGYSGLLHERKIHFNKVQNEILVSDHISGERENEFSVYFPLHIHKDVEIINETRGCFRLKHDSGVEVGVCFECEVLPQEIELSRGELDPINGWNAPSFLVKEPSQVIWFKKNCKKEFYHDLKIKIYEY